MGIAPQILRIDLVLCRIWADMFLLGYLLQVDRKITEEEAAKMAKAMMIDGQKRVVEKVLGRRKLKSSYEYEVKMARRA